MKYLIVCADDFGYSKVFNEKILELMKNRMITSTSAMVDWIDHDQKKQVQSLKELFDKDEGCVGLHVDFKSTNYDEEITRQYNKFQDIFRRPPAHVDIHTKKHMKNGYPKIMYFCQRSNLPFRNHGIKFDATITTDEPFFNTMNVEFEDILNWLKTLEDDKIYGIFFHPGIYDPGSKSSFNQEREKDNELLIRMQPYLRKFKISPVSYSIFNKISNE